MKYCERGNEVPKKEYRKKKTTVKRNTKRINIVNEMFRKKNCDLKKKK